MINKLTTSLGVFIASGLLFWSIFENGNINSYIDKQSLFIVVGGTIGTTLMAFSFSKIKSLLKIFKIAFLKSDADKVEELYQILHLSTLSKKQGGIFTISSEIEKIKDPFLAKGFNLILDNVNPENVKEIMTREIDSTAQRHQFGQDILGFMAEAAPAFGMIGTLVGLVGMLESLENSAQIGPNMAVALLTTLYGAVLANVIFIPLAKKLEKISEEEINIKEGLLDGIIAIQAEEQTLIIEEKLKSYLSTPLKNSLEERKRRG